MFPIIDAAAGMAFVYLLLSLICSALREALEGLLMQRPAGLIAGIESLVGSEISRRLRDHPLIAALRDHTSGPSYIPPTTFVTALLDVIKSDPNLPGNLQGTLRALRSVANDDEVKFRASLEEWFTAAMNSVARAYRRQTQAWLATIGICVTIAANADSIRMITALLDDAGLRTTLVQASGEFTSNAGPDAWQAYRQLKSMAMPIGWMGPERDNTPPWKDPWTGPWWTNVRFLLLWHWVGWLFTVAAVSLGAPFWFDLLKRVFPARTG